MRSALAAAAQKRVGRTRKGSLSTVPPASTSDEFDPELASVAAAILYLSPLPATSGRPIYILNASAFPDASDTDYDALLSYVLARLPEEDELLSGTEYEIVFFAGGPLDSATSEKRQGPGMGWYLQAYHVLSRATRKKLQRLYIVHPRTWVRVLIGVFGTVVSPKFRRKIAHDNTLTGLAEEVPIQTLLIPPAVYLHDRKLQPEIYMPGISGRRAFGARHPLPKNIDTGETRLPRVLRETTTFVLARVNLQTEGLFRIPPHATLQGILKEAYDRGQQFIIWKERGVAYSPPGLTVAALEEVRLEDAYGVHLAASLIKQWYRELRDPIFPEASYEFLKTTYKDTETEVSIQDLVDLFSPRSQKSPLTSTSRQILTRHLFPLLSEVSAFEADNRMGPANLAICFSMCLICGSNQLEDAKISSILKRLLANAISTWPKLREIMGISEASFEGDLKAPTDSRDYEDPLEEQSSQAYARFAAEEEHRIRLEDSEAPSVAYTAPKLPQRPQASNQDVARIPNKPQIPEKPSNIGSSKRTVEPSPIVPHRKPAPQVFEPPRYSSVFDSDGNSIHPADSPTNYGPVDGFAPPRRSDWSPAADEKTTAFLPSNPVPSTHSSAVNMPKRKAVSGDKPTTDQRPEQLPMDALRRGSADERTGEASATSGPAAIAQQAAAAVAARAANNRTSSREEVPSQPSQTRMINDVEATTDGLPEGEGVFRRPTWPASARQQALAKPVVRPVQPSLFSNNATLSAANVPRPRAPSPGLLKRMGSMEAPSTSETTPPPRSLHLEPRPLNLTRSSVEDLRRLYEERANTAQSLASAGLMRKTSL